MDLQTRAARVRLILFDIDGVLTDGKILLHADGTESKQFDIRDGILIVWAQRLGLTVGLLSARSSATTTERAAQLGITLIHQGVASKLGTYEEILRHQALSDAEVAYMGDDLLDLPVLARVGLSAAPSDAVEDVRGRVHWVSRSPGGNGAVRELLEVVLRAQGRWAELLASFLQEPTVSGAGQAPHEEGKVKRSRQ